MLVSRLMKSVAVVALAGAGQAFASPAISFENNNEPLVATTGAIDRTVGWTFTSAQPLRVTGLGYFDAGNTSLSDSFGDGLFVDHPIAIFDAAGNTLFQTVVAAGQSGTLVDNYRYAPADLLLDAGVEYTIASFAPEGTYGTSDPYDPLPDLTSDWLFPDGQGGVDARLPEVDLDPVLTFVGSRFQLFESDLVFPELTSTSIFGLEGANFSFEIIPTPSGAALLAGVGLLTLRRRRA